MKFELNYMAIFSTSVIFTVKKSSNFHPFKKIFDPKIRRDPEICSLLYAYMHNNA